MAAQREVRASAYGRIVLARHGEPSLDRRVKITARSYHDWWQRYQESGLKDGETPPPVLIDLARSSEILLSSTLRRSRETAAAIADGRFVLADEVFVEAPLPAPPVPLIRFTPRTWGGVSRIVWWLGYAAGGESRREAEVRAERAADYLIDHAASGANVLLCAHGWFNRMAGRVLRDRRWRRTYDGGDHYWAHRTYEPPV